MNIRILICAVGAMLAVSCGNGASKDNSEAADSTSAQVQEPAADAAAPKVLGDCPRTADNVIKLSGDGILAKGQELDKVTFVKFGASWCMPCKKFEPAFDEVASQVSEADFVAVDIDSCGQTAKDFEVINVPTLVIIGKDGQVKARYVGTGELLPAENFMKIVKDNL